MDDEHGRLCPECGGEMVPDWEGDPGVINGTRDLLTCKECGISVVPEGTPLADTERMFEWAGQNGLLPE